MKKRLRKKKHIGEFTELGFRFVGKFESELTEEQAEQFGDQLIDFVEAHDMGLGGGMGRKSFDMMAQHMPKKRKGKGFARGSCTDDHREIVKKFLMSRSEIAEFEIGMLVDMWHGGIETWDKSVSVKWNEFCGNV